MNNQLFDNNYGELCDKSDFIRENVLDTKGWSHEIKCPSCGKAAVQRDFDECLGGCINQVYSINCSHCGHHECDQEYCPICESVLDTRIEEGQKELQRDMVSGELLELSINHAIEEIQQKGTVKPHVFTNMKLVLLNNPSATWFCNVEGLLECKTHKETISVIKRKILDAKFNRNIELKIAQAKEELV